MRNQEGGKPAFLECKVKTKLKLWSCQSHPSKVGFDNSLEGKGNRARVWNPSHQPREPRDAGLTRSRAEWTCCEGDQHSIGGQNRLHFIRVVEPQARSWRPPPLRA